LVRKRIEIENLKYIGEDEVPERKRQTPWEAIFNSIPKGQALVIQPEDVPASSVREALKRLQSKGQFEQLYMVTRKVGKDRFVAYVVYPSK